MSEENNWVPSTCIIVAGLLGSGKTTAAQLLSELYSIPVVSAGNFFRVMAEARGLNASRATLQRLGVEFLREYGEDALSATLLREAYPAQSVIIEGVRPVGSVLSIRRQVSHCRILFIEASEPVRLSRIASRTEPVGTPQCDGSHSSIEEQPLAIRSIADRIVSNDGDIKDLKTSLNEAMAGFVS